MHLTLFKLLVIIFLVSNSSLYWKFQNVILHNLLFIFESKIILQPVHDTACSRDACGENTRCVSPTPLHSSCRIHIYMQTNGINTSPVPVIASHLIKFKALTTAPSRAGPLFIPSTSIFILHVHMLSHVQLFATLWTIDRQAPLSLGFPRQE